MASNTLLRLDPEHESDVDLRMPGGWSKKALPSDHVPVTRAV